MIELDEPDVQYLRCTCLDRARIALQNSGQHHCAGVVGMLQEEFNYICELMEVSSADPVHAMHQMFEYMSEYIREWENET